VASTVVGDIIRDFVLAGVGTVYMYTRN
jgi:hypothetical protein